MPFHTGVRLLVNLRGALLTAVVIIVALTVHHARSEGGAGLSARDVTTIDVALALLFVIGYASSIALAEASLARCKARVQRLGERAALAARGELLADPDAVKDALGKFDHVLCAIAAEVRSTNAQLKSAVELKSQFVATVSHELRTPLNGIIGMGEVLLRSPLDPDQREIAQSLHDSSTALLAIINDILDFSKLEAGRIELESIAFNPNELVNSVVDLLNRAAAAKPLTLMTYFAPDLPAKLLGDAGRLRQIVLNLIGNAVKFTEAGHVLVCVDVASTNGGRALIRWRVTDSGIGMTKEASTRIFEPFAQGDTSTTRRFGGTGLGLAICKGFVELMDGTIEIESTYQKGTSVSFTVPLEIVELAKLPATAHLLQDIRTLIVSSEIAVRETIERYVFAWRMRSAAITEDHEQALRSLREAVKDGDPFGVVIVDCSSVGERCSLCASIREDKALAGTSIAILNAYGVACAGEIANRRRRPLLQSEVLDTIVNALHATTPEHAGERAPVIDDDLLFAKRLRVLVAEDNAINRSVASRQLDILGASSFGVANGMEAIAAVKRDDFDVVLMDCNMPVMDGFAATREIRAREEWGGNHLPIIAMTANASSSDRDACLAAGMDDYLAKPVTINTLRTVLERVFFAQASAVGGP